MTLTREQKDELRRQARYAKPLSETEVAIIEADDDDTSALQARYEELTGNSGDPRWKPDTWAAKIAEAEEADED